MPRPRSYHREYAEILRRDPCCYCGRPMRHIDHIEAVASGGSNDWDNLTAACRQCNQQKNDGSLLRFLWRRRTASEYPPQPATGVRLRRDTLMWDARAYAGNKTFLLGSFDTPKQAVEAIDAWKLDHPNVLSARQLRQAQRYPVILQMLQAGQTMREIAAELSISLRAVEGCMRDMRNKGLKLPSLGRGGPGKRRKSRPGVGADGKGYRYDGDSRALAKWLVQVQRHGDVLRARFDTEAQAQAAVAEFRDRHARRPDAS